MKEGGGIGGWKREGEREGELHKTRERKIDGQKESKRARARACEEKECVLVREQDIP